MAEIRIGDNRSLGELFSELSRETSTLLRQEVQLAKAEISQKVSKIGRDVAFLAVGGLTIYAGFLALLAALIIGLAEFMDGWLAALIVGALVIAVGYFLVQKGINELRRVNPVPERTIETLREDKEWIQDQIR
jgi:hypothetical protein